MRTRMLIAALAAVAALGLAAVAQAAKVTGGTTTVTPSHAAAALLAANHITVTPLAPATAAQGTFTFPIARGHVNVKNLRGRIFHRGGIKVTNGTKTVVLRRPAVVSTKRGAFLYAAARKANRCRLAVRHLACHLKRHWRVVRIGRLSDVARDGGKVTATVHITAFTAKAVNRLAGKHVVAKGAVLGTATTAPTLKAKPAT